MINRPNPKGAGEIHSPDAPHKNENNREEMPLKKEVKKRIEDGGEDDEDVDGENDKSGDETVPLLDQTLEISDARERKKVERFTEKFNKLKETEAIEIPKGKGTPRGQVPRTDAFVKKFKADALKQLHRVLLYRVGKVTLKIKQQTNKEDERDKEGVEDKPDEEASSDDSESKSKSKKGHRSQSKKTSKEDNTSKSPNKKPEKKSSAKKWERSIFILR
ncbi:uncharacterized protein LOC126101231 [Schistocerca cancellata]|uniref:uncharacterized protein LOC126101231 n=1 Tax=Schistocerca cancellata TaxID=274614 RepID=UPI0021196AA7|nr:uncharacterized protein LOC126101231 [Schistocerca cancellata]